MKRTRLRKVGKAGTVHKRMHAIWRQIILKRDGAFCQKCGTESGVLQAHHIVAKKKRPRMRYRLENGMILCNACHFWIERVATDFERMTFLTDEIAPERLAALDLLSKDRSKPKVDLKAVELWLTQQLKGAAK